MEVFTNGDNVGSITDRRPS